MARLAQIHPGYGFERNMGYAVPEHIEALTRLGPTIHHRQSFAPVRLWGVDAAYDEVVPNLLPL
jgi:ribonuclease HII